MGTTCQGSGFAPNQGASARRSSAAIGRKTGTSPIPTLEKLQIPVVKRTRRSDTASNRSREAGTRNRPTRSRRAAPSRRSRLPAATRAGAAHDGQRSTIVTDEREFDDSDGALMESGISGRRSRQSTDKFGAAPHNRSCHCRHENAASGDRGGVRVQASCRKARPSAWRGRARPAPASPAAGP